MTIEPGPEMPRSFIGRIPAGTRTGRYSDCTLYSHVDENDCKLFKPYDLGDSLAFWVIFEEPFDVEEDQIRARALS